MSNRPSAGLARSKTQTSADASVDGALMRQSLSRLVTAPLSLRARVAPPRTRNAGFAGSLAER